MLSTFIFVEIYFSASAFFQIDSCNSIGDGIKSSDCRRPVKYAGNLTHGLNPVPYTAILVTGS